MMSKRDKYDKKFFKHKICGIICIELKNEVVKFSMRKRLCLK